MLTDKVRRMCSEKKQVQVFCPTCNAGDFLSEEGNDIIVCISCKREFTKSGLIQENSDLKAKIEFFAKEKAEQIMEEFVKEIKKKLK